jgi:hypothetical protein
MPNHFEERYSTVYNFDLRHTEMGHGYCAARSGIACRTLNFSPSSRIGHRQNSYAIIFTSQRWIDDREKNHFCIRDSEIWKVERKIICYQMMNNSEERFCDVPSYFCFFDQKHVADSQTCDQYLRTCIFASPAGPCLNKNEYFCRCKPYSPFLTDTPNERSGDRKRTVSWFHACRRKACARRND